MDALTTSLITAFLLGLFSSAHCIAMCGSVIGALTLTLPVEIRQQPRKMFPFVFNYNVGRILSYAIAGGIVGFIASPLTQINGLSVLRYLSVLVMIGMGLYLAGWFPKFAHAEKIGAPIWRKLQPIGQKLLPVRTLKQAFLLGAVWGWLPCGLVYAGLAVAATTGDPIYAASVMLAFGLGTLPAVMGAGMFAGMLASLARNQLFRKLAGLLIIVMALLLLLWPHGGHDHVDMQPVNETSQDNANVRHDH